MPDWLDADITTLPDLLKQAGYATAHFGKWHLGEEEFYPTKHGFDVNIGGMHTTPLATWAPRRTTA